MLDKVSEAAERLAVHVSRRDFFDWAGKSAMAVAGLLAFGGIAGAAGGCPKGYFACASGTYGYICCPNGTSCCHCNGIAACLKGNCKRYACI
jgi:hypothetical protein